MAFERIDDRPGINIPREYTCESADVKPTTGVLKHSTCWEYDTKAGFIFDGTSWREV